MGTRFDAMLRRMDVAIHSVRQRTARLQLPSFLRFDVTTGAIRPEDKEAEPQSQALGLTMKEYVVSDEWDPDMDGIDP